MGGSPLDKVYPPVINITSHPYKRFGIYSQLSILQYLYHGTKAVFVANDDFILCNLSPKEKYPTFYVEDQSDIIQ